MVKVNMEYLLSLLNAAKQKGCTKVKLQLYENWDDIEKEQKSPSQRLEEYQVDTRFYNTVEFETEIKNMEATDKIITKIEENTFIVRVSLSDRDSLLKNLGITEFHI